MGLVSTIYHRANAAPPDDDEAQRRKRAAYAEAWHRHGLVVIEPDSVNDDLIRQAVINEANRQYGQRGR